MARWEKLPALKGKPNPCLHCPPIQPKASMDKIIAVGFGVAYLERDGEVIYEERGDDYIDFREAERLASADPDHNWRAILHGPLHGETYQRQGPEEWVLVEKNEGFA